MATADRYHHPCSRVERAAPVAAAGNRESTLNGLPERDDHLASFDMVAARAGSLGYRLAHEPGTAAGWTLLDAADGEPLYEAPTLADIARYLDG
ncbi:hypothetical protein [Nocardia rhamnosiphila]|uniref:Uncharacterized protein n=1 Tax=Nocardia rhamnosiphila TaxID=426716 RepID=A0ABV2WWH7_9NOCA